MSSRAPPAYTLASKSEGWRESVVAAAAARVAMRVRWRRSSSDVGGELLSGTVAAADADPDVGRDVATDRFAIRVRWRWTSSTVDGGSVGAQVLAQVTAGPRAAACTVVADCDRRPSDVRECAPACRRCMCTSLASLWGLQTSFRTSCHKPDCACVG